MQTTIEKKSKITSIIFLLAIIAITVFLVVFTFIMIGKPFVIDNFDEIETVNISDYKSQSDDEYYVFVYNTNNYKHELIDEMIIEYAENARTDSSLKEIFVLNYLENKDIIAKEHMNITNTDSSIEKGIPALLLIKDGKISETMSTVSTIKTALYDEMNK